MSNALNYLFTTETPDGALVFRSTVESFGLQNVTDKDLTSFYTHFSQHAYFDTGLLPVEGSGVLSIRRALNHTQVAYQHAPGAYYVNWGEYERDSEAQKYLVAQPYRIVIIDFLDDNIYGARTFYSPVPITYSQAPLYHVNLPNINCRGYNGNGVGWICLYHTEDISTQPFSERLVLALDRCSGTETYNDANMSETDGTRFYMEHRPNDQFLWDPVVWQRKTEQEGIDWTLDPDLWLPVLVTSWDDQGGHNASGQPLTVADALLGTYKAYYSDPIPLKPVNQIARYDAQLDTEQLFRHFKVAYMRAQNANHTPVVINPFHAAEQHKQLLSTISTQNLDADEEQESYDYECEHCGEGHEGSDTPFPYVCASCFDEYYIYDEDQEEHYHIDSVEATVLIENIQSTPSLCWGACNVDHDSRVTASFSHRYANSDTYNTRLAQSMVFANNRFLYDNLQFIFPDPFMLNPGVLIDFISDQEIVAPINLLEDLAALQFSDQDPAGIGLEVQLSALCRDCSSIMFSSPVLFDEHYKFIRGIISAGLGNIKAFHVSPQLLRDQTITLLSSPFTSIHHVPYQQF